MTTANTPRATVRRTARLGLAAAALLVAVTGASADEGGLGGFLSSIFGDHSQQAPATAAAAPDAASQTGSFAGRVHRARVHAMTARVSTARALTVRLRQTRSHLAVAQSPTKPGKVSIYADRTLRRGDAVMTADGVRIFAGSSSWPYTAGDFVVLKDAKNVDHDTSKVLALLDKAPRG